MQWNVASLLPSLDSKKCMECPRVGRYGGAGSGGNSSGGGGRGGFKSKHSAPFKECSEGVIQIAV